MKTIYNLLILTVIFNFIAFGGTVTVLTHGYNSSAGNTNGWLWNMALKMGEYDRRKFEYGGNKSNSFYIVYFDNSILKSKLLFGVEPDKNPSGDIFIVLDWNPYSGDPTYLVGPGIQENKIKSTTYTSYFVANYILTNKFDGLKTPLTFFPIHLIGHSRGGSLMCEVGKRFAEYGIYVHHLTTLDPHPVNNDGFNSIIEGVAAGNIVDGSATNGLTSNIIFADNYFQKNATIKGSFVNGAANKDLSSAFTNKIAFDRNSHTMAHFWYHCTLSEEYPSTTDGENRLLEIERTKWFSESESAGGKAGYYSSYRAGQFIDNFTKFGYNTEFLKSLVGDTNVSFSNYRSIPPDRDLNFDFKNIISFSFKSTNSIKYKTYLFGEPIDYIPKGIKQYKNIETSIVYQADLKSVNQNQNVPLYFFVDDDENLINGYIKWKMVNVPSTGAWKMKRFDVDCSDLFDGLKPGQYRMGAMLGESSGARCFYAHERVEIQQETFISWNLNKSENFLVLSVYGNKNRKYSFQKSSDLISWFEIYSGYFQPRTQNVIEGLDIIPPIKTEQDEKSFYKVIYN